jgi:hypothetical protein
VDFIHLTLQEFYLAKVLKDQPLPQVLQQHWDDARYEETLGLLIAMLYQAQRCDDIEQGLRWLVEWGEATHRRTPAVLWHRRRSPLRVAFHLLHRASVPLEHLPHMADFLWKKLYRAPRRRLWGIPRRSALRKWAAVRDAHTPPYLLQKLAQDADEGVRRDAAWNRSTPPEVLARLAQDADEGVRRGVAGNPNTPPEVLARLAQDAEVVVRRGVAENPNTLWEDL